MKRFAIIAGVLLFLMSSCLALRAYSTVWTYQGKLMEDGQGANGLYEMTFALFTSDTGGNAVATITNSNVSVSDGLFTTRLDFGASVFDGTDYWIEIGVVSSGSSEHIKLSPRHEVLATPYAISSENARSLANPQFFGTTTKTPLNLMIDNMVAFRIEPSSNTVNIVGGSEGNRVDGSIGVAISGGGFSQAPNIVRMGQEFASDFAVVSGGAGNEIIGGRFALIGGGGTNLIQERTIDGAFSSIVGGAHNELIATRYGFIGGGQNNKLHGGGVPGLNDHSSIVGGLGNQIEFGGLRSFIGSGTDNYIVGTHDAAIMGGVSNRIDAVASYASISGGLQNRNNGQASFIGGGFGNGILGQNVLGMPIYGAFIGAGRSNVIHGPSEACSISGGTGNSINSFSTHATIGGGHGNTLGQHTSLTTIAGGGMNSIEDGIVEGSFIGGGVSNVIETGPYAIILGGAQNSIEGFQGMSSFIGSGSRNRIMGAGYSHSLIAGGLENVVVGDNPSFCVVGGGRYNVIGGGNMFEDCLIGGGASNNITGIVKGGLIAGGKANSLSGLSDGTVSGGFLNTIERAEGGTIGGGRRNGIQQGSTGAVIGGGHENQVSKPFGTIPGGLQSSSHNFGQMAYASGAFAAAGDAQTSTMVLRGTTSDGATTELFLDGEGERMVVPDNGTWALDVLVVARDELGNSAAWRLQGAAQNNAGTTVMLAPPIKTSLGAIFPGQWDVNLFAPATNGVLTVQATGVDATEIRWVTTVRTSEVVF